jgi:hypothetical protein
MKHKGGVVEGTRGGYSPTSLIRAKRMIIEA